tara:strand:- start:1180 stop:3216 length:2037 start_codon:yes stop_codon:yes gene_type:complete
MKKKLSVFLLGVFSVVAHADGLLCFAQNYLSVTDTPGTARRVCIVDSTAYVADQTGGLTIVDISDPSMPVQIGSYSSGTATAFNIQVEEDIAYVVTSDEGLQIIDVSSPKSPLLIGEYPATSAMYDVQIDGSVAYIANHIDGIMVLDIYDLSNPTLVTTLQTVSQTMSLDIVGGMLYSAESSGGMRIYDLSDPLMPAFISEINDIGQILDIDVVDSKAYLVKYLFGLSVVDVTDPTSPELLSETWLAEPPHGIQVVDDRAYMVSGWIGRPQGLYVLDVSDPKAPVIENLYATTGFPVGLDIVDSKAYIADRENGLQIIDVSTPPSFIADFDESEATLEHIVVSEDFAYILGNSGDFLVYDISDQSNPIQVGGIDADPWSNYSFAGIQYDNGKVYLKDRGDSVWCVDLSDPTNPTLLGRYQGEYTNRFDMVGSIAYLVGSSVIEVVDLNDIDSPVVMGISSRDGSTSEVEVHDSIMYIASGQDGLMMYDVQDPNSVTLLGAASFEVDYYYGLTVLDGTAYVGNNRSGMQIIDVRNPAQSVLLSKVDTPKQAIDVVVSGETAYCVDYNQLSVIDVTDKTLPELLVPVQLPSDARHMVIRDETAFLPSERFMQSGLITIDLSTCDLCSADITGDGTVNFFDVSAFLLLFTAQDPDADYTQDGQWNFFDVSAFLLDFAAGCP